MTDTNIDLSPDANGQMVLTLRGDRSQEVERALSSLSWDVLALFAIDLPDYTFFRPYSEKIKWLRVPFGPDSSNGIEQLTELRKVQLKDAPKPPIDFRQFPKLELLEVIWQKKCPSTYNANENLRTLLIHNAGSSDLSWLSTAGRLEYLELRGGMLLSLSGLDRIKTLRHVHAVDLRKCISVDAIMQLPMLETLEIDAPNARLDSLEWLRSMGALRKLELHVSLQNVDWSIFSKLDTLKTVSITGNQESNLLSDSEIVALLSGCERVVRSFQRFTSKLHSFQIEYE